MVIFLDDADNHPSVTLDILHTVRVFLDHPRIIVVLAGNLKQIRQSVVIDEFEGLGDAMRSFRQASPATEREWRQFARRHSEEFLEKVLPRPARFYLSIAEDDASSGIASRDEYRKFLGVSFDEYSAAQMDLYRADYFEWRWKTDERYRKGQKELHNEADRQNLERFMSWWVLRFWYENALRPKTVRHLLTLRAYTQTLPNSPGIIDRTPNAHRKRLPVILFENPENHELIHRFTDSDQSINAWLHRQVLKSEWVGDRYIDINSVKHYADTYSYSYLLYRLDLDAALPVRFSGEGKAPATMLPRLAGPNLITQRAFFKATRPQRLTGIAAQLNHSLVPSNCYFLFGLSQLPDNAFESLETEGTRSSFIPLPLLPAQSPAI